MNIAHQSALFSQVRIKGYARYPRQVHAPIITGGCFSQFPGGAKIQPLPGRPATGDVRDELGI